MARVIIGIGVGLLLLGYWFGTIRRAARAYFKALDDEEE